MILDKLWKAIISKVPEKDRIEFTAGIVTGIVAGIVTGIVAGILAGLAAGILAGIVAGIVTGLAAGLAAGIVTGIVAGIVTGIVTGIGDFLQSPLSLYSILILLGVLFIASEILFIYDKKKPEEQSHFDFTLERKVIAWLESSVILFSLIGLRQSAIKGYPFMKDFLGAYGLTMLNFAGWGTAIIVIIYLYIKVNSLKYKRG